MTELSAEQIAEWRAETNGPGWFWTRTEWSEWSNHLTTLIPEDLFAGNPDGAQESVIEDTIVALIARLAEVERALRLVTDEHNNEVRRRCAAEAALAVERAKVAAGLALAEEWDRLADGNEAARGKPTRVAAYYRRHAHLIRAALAERGTEREEGL